MLDVQRRVVGHLDRVRRVHPDGRIAIVSHGDVIRAAVLHYLGLSLDAHGLIEISPATVSTLILGDWGAKIMALNETVSG